MHVLLITSEELNEDNTLASIFELSQARALQQAGIKVGILSVGYFTTANAAREIVGRVMRKRRNHYRFRKVQLPGLAKYLAGSIHNTLLNKTNVRKLELQGVTVYESLYNKLLFSMNERAHWKWIRHGYKGYEEYVKDHGRPQIIHAHSRFLLAAMLAKRIRERDNIPYVLTEHSSFYMRNLVQDFQVKLIRECIDHASLLTVVSTTLGKKIDDKLDRSNHFKVVPNILDRNFDKVPELADSTNFTFLSVSNLDSNKNQQLLIHAFSRIVNQIPTAILKIGGSGAEYQNLVSLSETLGLSDRIFFLGYLTHEQVLAEMNNCNLFILPSKFETFGVVLIEALACGKPVIATKCGGPEDIINETNGLLTEHDPDALARAMLYMYQNINNYNSRQIKDACLNKYSSEAVVRQWISIYQEVLN